MAVIFIRAVILYLLLIFAVRLMGKRQIGELQPTELAITILISNLATLPIEDPGDPLLVGIIPILVLAGLDVLMSQLQFKSRKIRKLMCGTPAVIIRDGVIDQAKMKDLRFTIDDLTESLRIQGIFNIDEVQYAVVETTGAVSVYQKYKNQPASNESVGSTGQDLNPPCSVIDNGKIIIEGLDEAKLTLSDMIKILHAEKIEIENVFFMSCDKGGEYVIVRKTGGGNL
ncbi:MAG: DUF421 domain-containing protein [Ruminococcus sp.]|jgi:uncharacterized membrane protein YcaP (DUF421 family)|nr:DUF421 domain-containing protein [Ruminococcus sp.]